MPQPNAASAASGVNNGAAQENDRGSLGNVNPEELQSGIFDHLGLPEDVRESIRKSAGTGKRAAKAGKDDDDDDDDDDESENRHRSRAEDPENRRQSRESDDDDEDPENRRQSRESDDDDDEDPENRDDDDEDPENRRQSRQSDDDDDEDPENRRQSRQSDDDDEDPANRRQDREDKPPKPNKDWPEEVQAEFNKRVGKIWGQRKAAEKQAEQLRQQLEEAGRNGDGQQRRALPKITDKDPLGAVRDIRELSDLVTTARLTRKWCRRHKDGVVLNQGTDKEVTKSAEEINQMLERAEDILDGAPAKAQFFKDRSHWNEVARTEYPDLFDKDSEDYQTAGMLLGQLPGLAEHPAVMMLVGDYLVGARLRAAKHSKKNGKDKGEKREKAREKLPAELQRENPPVAPGAAKGPTDNDRKGAPNRKKLDEALKQVIASGGDQASLTRYVETGLHEFGGVKGGRIPAPV